MNDPAKHLDGAGQAGSAVAGFSVRRPVTICMIFISILAFGLIATGRIPLKLLPDLEAPFLGVFIPYSNSTPEQTLEAITKPLEEVLGTVPGVSEMNSTAAEDYTVVQVNFDWGRDLGVMRAEIREKVELIRPDLPEDVRRIVVQNFSTDDIPILEGTIASNRDLRSSYDFLDLKIKKPIERLPGVAEVEMWGVNRKQLDIYLRFDDIGRYNVDVASLFRKLDAANTNLSLGKVNQAGERFEAITKGAIDSVEDIAKFPVNERGQLLEDIADIIYDQPISNSGQHLNGDYSIGFSVKKSSEANTVDVVRSVKEVIEGFKKDPALEGVRTYIWHDSAKEITNSLSALLNAGLWGSFLAVGVLYLFLRRLTASLVVGLAIPVSVVAALGFLYFSGTTLNALSMLGLMLSTGMLVDNAVVVLESIYQKLEKGVDRETAARVGAGEVTTAVIAATLTSIIIFLPLIFGQDTQMSIMLGEAGMSIVFALLCSLFISLTLIPIAMAKWLTLDLKSAPKWQRRVGEATRAGVLAVGRRLWANRAERADGWTTHGRVTRWYLSLVAWPLQRPLLTGLVLAPAIFGVSLWVLMEHVPDNSPDAQELSGLTIQYEFSENYHYVKIEEDFVNPVEAFLEENLERFKITSYMSRYYNDSASTRVYFDKERVNVADMVEIRKQIGEGLPVIPGAEITPGSQGRNNNWIQADVFGDDPRRLTQIGQDLKNLIQAHEDFDEAHTEPDRAQQEVQIRLNRDLARKYGISPQEVGGILGIVSRPRQMRGFRTAEGEVEIWMRMHPDDLKDLNDLKSVIVGTGSDGKPIELRQVANFETEKIPARIRRQNRRTNTWLAAVYSGEKREEGRKEFSKILDDYPFPPGYGWAYGFWTKQAEKENEEFMFNIALALFMVFFVMAALFESVLQPFAIMFSLPFAVVGVAWFLLITGTPFNPMAMIGMIVLVGIVVNNGIVLLDHINNLRRKGLPRSEAIMEGCSERLRPIVMTAATTIVGLMPLAFGDSGFFNMRYFPMARTVMGGLMASTVLTLVVLPTYYCLVDDLGRYCKRTCWRRIRVRSRWRGISSL